MTENKMELGYSSVYEKLNHMLKEGAIYKGK
jgi:hypothetical protein